jgi:hypothetical protein
MASSRRWRTATVDGGCGLRLQTMTTAPDEDNACMQWQGRQLAVGGGQGGQQG